MNVSYAKSFAGFCFILMCLMSITACSAVGGDASAQLNGVDIYENAGFSRTVGTIPENTSVRVFEHHPPEYSNESGWYKIRYEGREAWITDDYLGCPRNFSSPVICSVNVDD
ncbi:MAG: SH3 domain-containing protein [Leptolyngbya sp. SIO1E4]|nr:SH3 domain-containing protein [Leptolyngbya sp. SIO1E4]